MQSLSREGFSHRLRAAGDAFGDQLLLDFAIADGTVVLFEGVRSADRTRFEMDGRRGGVIRGRGRYDGVAGWAASSLAQVSGSSWYESPLLGIGV